MKKATAEAVRQTKDTVGQVKHIAFMMYPVKDVARARRFYEEDLGLKLTNNFREQWTPSILIQGSLDTNVTQEDFEALKSALAPSGGASKWIDGLDHVFVQPGSERVDPVVPGSIAEWIKGRPGSQASPSVSSLVPRPADLAQVSQAFRLLNTWSTSSFIRGF